MNRQLVRLIKGYKKNYNYLKQSKNKSASSDLLPLVFVKALSTAAP